MADSLNIIDQVCFRDKIATTRELYDALINNWEGHEDLRQYIVVRCSHFGNNDPETDKYLKFVADTYSEASPAASARAAAIGRRAAGP